jgi:serine/threonine-protein kinase HipA
MTPSKRLHMVMNGQEIGHLDQSSGGALHLTAPPLEGVPRLSLAFAPSTEHVRPRQALAYVEGLLPEGDQVRAATARRFGVSPRSPFALLGAIGQDCPGAVQFLDDQQLEEPLGDALEPIEEHAIGTRLRALRTDPTAPWAADGEHWSLGGAQSKIALREVDGRWYEARGTAPTTHILKPGISALTSNALVEHVSLRALSLLGLPTADSSFREFGGEEAIVVRRYDRLEVDGRVYRIHQEDLCQATSTLPADKYVPTAPQLVATLRTGGVPDDDVMRFALSVLANWMLGAPDGHAKNYSVLIGVDQVALAPLYDVATGFGQETTWPTLAMGIGGEKQMDRIGARHVRRFARDLGYDPEALVDVALALARATPEAFRTAMGEPEVPGSERSYLSHVLDRIARHCERVAVDLGSE